MKPVLTGLGLAGLLALSACGTVPHTTAQIAEPAAPAAWRNLPATADAAPWQTARPGDALDKGAWWTVFADTQLNALQQQALSTNPSLQAAAARVRLARAVLDGVGVAALPRVDGGLRNARTRTSENRPATTAAAQASTSVQNDWVMSASVSYELDLWGRQQLDQDAAQAGVQQVEADGRNAQLVLSADLAATYFSLRSLDAEIAVVEQGLQAQSRAADLLALRRAGGVASGLDSAQQQALLDATRTQLTLLLKQRGQLEHALATLVGTPASAFALPAAQQPAAWSPAPVVLPVVLPSEVLQRRPDIASAQRAVAAANAQLGLAELAWYPSLTLSTNTGWESKHLSSLLEAPSLLWAVGGGLTQPLWDGGRLRARQAQAQASQELAATNYRQVVLRALQEVEDGLLALNTLSTAQTQAQAAVRSAERVLTIAQDRYTGGLATYLDVVTAQQNALNNQRLSTQLRAQQLQATVYLVKALGGGWGPA